MANAISIDPQPPVSQNLATTIPVFTMKASVTRPVILYADLAMPVSW